MNVEAGMKKEKPAASAEWKVKSSSKEKATLSEKDKCGVNPKKSEKKLSAWMCARKAFNTPFMIVISSGDKRNSYANFLSFEGLQRLIPEKEELTFKRNQLLVQRDQTILRLSELETKVTEAVGLEARLQQSEQEVVNLSKEIRPLRVRFDEAKAKWAEVQNVVLAATDREAASAERVINLEATLNSKSEELAVMVEKHAQLEEKYRKTIEHNRLFSSTVCELDVSLKYARSTQENLSTEVTQLKEELKRRAASLMVEKPYSMYSTRRKSLEEAKTGITDIDAEIAKAQELELAAKNGLPAQSDAPGSSDSGSEFSEIEEGSEGDDAED
ncbi:uncharacterized protein [Nicotiana tomentosiformis]|uniref:uncharacterized protein n=1 Tax=Nicotiana tomentosiformis TaxID=4098 RepID=UPI00388C6C36